MNSSVMHTIMRTRNKKGVIQMGFVNERTEDRDFRTIDRARDMVLKRISGSRPDSGEKYEFQVQGVSINFMADTRARIHGNPKLGERHQYEMNWLISTLYIPENMRARSEEIKQAIIEALKVRGWNCSVDRTYSVNVEVKKIEFVRNRS